MARKKATAQRGPTALPRNRGTGFEEYFADPPMTTDEAAEEQLDIYARTLPFEERIQSCIQRFRSRRRLQGERVTYFNEYLFLGGVDTSPIAYGGLDYHDLKDLTPAERRDLRATDTVHSNSGADARFYNGNKKDWIVDFAGVAAGFCSTALGELTNFDPKKFDVAIGVVENFLRYVVLHDVCPEYKDNIDAALQICQKARAEWPMLNRLKDTLPGPFNLAATKLFSNIVPDDLSIRSAIDSDGFDAKAIFLSACVLLNMPGVLAAFKAGTILASGEMTCTVRINKIERSSRALKAKFDGLRIGGRAAAIESIGKMHLEHTTIRDAWALPKVQAPRASNDFWVYLEDDLMLNFVPGMKMNMTVMTLTTGIYIIKTISDIMPSFYTFLPQQMMKHYVHPRQHDRPAPSIHDDGREAPGDEEA